MAVGSGVGDGCVFVPTVALAPELPFICAEAFALIGVGDEVVLVVGVAEKPTLLG